MQAIGSGARVWASLQPRSRIGPSSPTRGLAPPMRNLMGGADSTPPTSGRSAWSEPPALVGERGVLGRPGRALLHGHAQGPPEKIPVGRSADARSRSLLEERAPRSAAR